MKTLFLIPILIMVIVTPQKLSLAQRISGQLLIGIVEPGASENPGRLFLANTADGSLSELLVEDRSINSIWFGWSPDGQTLAYLAPARDGINHELWLGNPDGTNLRTPFLNEGQQTPVMAAWNPLFNIVAVATSSEETRDGIFLVNANNDNVVFLAEEIVAPDPILDWSRDAYYLTYSTAENALKIINTRDRAITVIQDVVDFIPIMPPHFASGWAANDGQYLWTDERYTALQPENLFVDVDPFTAQMVANGSEIVDFDGLNFRQLDAVTGAIVETYAIPEDLFVEDFSVAGDKTIYFNALHTDANGNSIMGCYLLRDGNVPEEVKAIMRGTWTHTRCQVLEGNTYVAMMATTSTASWERLPEATLYELIILPTDLSDLFQITDSYGGFEFAPIGFSRGQAVFQEHDSLVVYSLQGEKVTLATLADLDIASTFVQYRFEWQP